MKINRNFLGGGGGGGCKTKNPPWIFSGTAHCCCCCSLAPRRFETERDFAVMALEKRIVLPHFTREYAFDDRKIIGKF